ncbi:hypothetical protein [Sphingomonas sp. VL_57B]|jgi:hypothetical protein
MNLRAIANRATSGINPNIPATISVSIGAVTATNGKRIPAYAAPAVMAVQVQALEKEEIKHLDSLNISNAQASVYVDMQLSGADRTTGSGGDLISFGTGIDVPAPLRGQTWLVVAVLEGWVTGSWCKAAITRQMPAP